MKLLLTFLIGFFAGLRSLMAPDDCVGCAPGLAEDPAPALPHWLSSLCRDFYRARSDRTYRRQTAADTEPHVAPGLDRAYCDGWVDGRMRCR